MKLSRSEADVYVPSGGSVASAWSCVTQLCVAAHQDDIEIMAQAGISDCLDDPAQGFGGVVVTNGAGSPRTGAYSNYSDAEMQAVRREEQRTAARLGRYAIQVQLAHPSADFKRPGHAGVAADLDAVFLAGRPHTVYLHNPADKHDTHVAVFLRCIESLRRLPADRRPAKVLGCEVWRDLDWLVDADKVALDSGRHPEQALQLLKVFDSQVTGGKRYDRAGMGRREAHATFHTSHATDRFKGITWAMDLTPLLTEPTRDPAEFTLAYIDRLKADVLGRMQRFA